jgi:hypothetical protein
MLLGALFATLSIPSALAGAQDDARARLEEHGRMAMGFDQDKAAHHFTLTAHGGTIAVTANDPSDGRTRDQVRVHLKEIAEAFGKGDFEKPLMTHGETPPGVADMQRYQAQIRYTFEPIDTGGVVRIATSSKPALKAVHQFLRYQITEHATGDKMTVHK